MTPAGPRDLGPLVDLWVAAWTAAMPQIDFEARRLWFEAHLRDALDAGGRLIVSGTEGAPAGFALVNIATATLEQLAVAPASQGRGTASLLMRQCKALCPAGLWLKVNTDNHRAVRFYERHGFRVTGETVNPRSGLPVWTMAWSDPD